MAQQSSSAEKTEEPTDRKLQEGRKKGQVWKSRDLSGVLVFLAGFGVLKFFWPFVEAEVHHLYSFVFERLSHPTEVRQSIGPVLYRALLSLGLLVLPVALGGAVIGGMSDFLQTGGVFSFETMLPKFDKLNPIQGLKNIFSKKQLIELVKSSAKIFAGSYVVYGALRDGARLMVLSPRVGVEGIFAVMGELMFQIALRLGLLFLAFSIFDVWWQRRLFLKEMRMTKEEVKREFKETEGDPQYKSRRRELYQEILENIQVESVKDADVVVTNPEHVAVALKYNREKDQAPRVVAKGLDLRAQAIKAVAKDAGVLQMRNVPLAHALFRVEVGDEIPEALYDAVAEVLNFVYGLRTDPT
jgi:flagellar biosynthetic protein FlhB